MLGMGPEAHGDEVDLELINAGKARVTELPGRRVPLTLVQAR